MVAEYYTLVKTCRACLIEKAWADFYICTSSGKPRGRCKDCTNAAKRKGHPRGSNITENGKICARCKAEKPFSDYGFNNKQRTEIKSCCKDCSREAKAEWNKKNRESVNSQVGDWKRRNPKAVRITAQNRRARKAGDKLSPGLVEKLFKLQRGLCACCGKPLGERYHLDHRMPLALGGTNTDDNMQLLTQRCNNQKGAKHPVEFMQSRGLLL